MANVASPEILGDSSRDSIRKDSEESANDEKLDSRCVDGVPRAHAPKSPEERYAALQAALKVDPGPKPWGWAAIQVSTYGLTKLRLYLPLSSFFSFYPDSRY
jgi:hypothetical protein